MASSCSVDSHRSANRPSTLDKLVVAPLNTPVHGLHKNRPPHSPSPTKAQARTSRASTPCGSPSITFNGLTKRWSVLPYGDHVKGGQVPRSGSHSHAQQRKMAPQSPAHSSYSGTKIVPHITRPGTSCLRPPTSEILPVKVSQPSGQCSLVGTRAHTPVRCEEDSIRAVWTPGELLDSDPTVCPAKRIASCPAQVSVPCATGESDEQTPASPVCRTAPVHTFAAANRSKVGPRSSCGRASPGLRLDTVVTPKGHEPAAGTIAADRARSAGGGHQTPQLFSHPVIFEDCHTPQSCSQTANTPSEGVCEDTFNGRTPETAAQRCRTATALCTPHSVSEFYTSADGPISAAQQSAPMVLSLVDFFDSSKEVIELEVAKMTEAQLEQLENSLDQATRLSVEG